MTNSIKLVSTTTQASNSSSTQLINSTSAVSISASTSETTQSTSQNTTQAATTAKLVLTSQPINSATNKSTNSNTFQATTAATILVTTLETLSVANNTTLKTSISTSKSSLEQTAVTTGVTTLDTIKTPTLETISALTNVTGQTSGQTKMASTPTTLTTMPTESALTSESPTTKSVVANGSLETSIPWDPDLANSSSIAFQNKATLVENDLKKFFKSSDDVNDATVTVTNFTEKSSRRKRRQTNNGLAIAVYNAELIVPKNKLISQIKASVLKEIQNINPKNFDSFDALDDLTVNVSAIDSEKQAAEATTQSVKQSTVSPIQSTSKVTANLKPVEVKPSYIMPNIVKPVEVRPVVVIPEEVRPVVVKPAETKPATDKPATEKPADHERVNSTTQQTTIANISLQTTESTLAVTSKFLANTGIAMTFFVIILTRIIL